MRLNLRVGLLAKDALLEWNNFERAGTSYARPVHGGRHPPASPSDGQIQILRCGGDLLVGPSQLCGNRPENPWIGRVSRRPICLQEVGRSEG